jgi:hypothetical protein
MVEQGQVGGGLLAMAEGYQSTFLGLDWSTGRSLL